MDQFKGGGSVILSTYALALAAAGKSERAQTVATQAAELDNCLAEPLINKSTVQVTCGDYEGAVESANRALAIDPENASAKYNRGIAELWLGNYREGFRDFEWRPNGPKRHGSLDALWDGSFVDGTLQISTEQGFGDSIQFSRFLPLVRERCQNLVVETSAPLARLFSLMPAVDSVIEVSKTENADPEPQAHSLMMSLPHCMGIDSENALSANNYLEADKADQQLWKSRIENSARGRLCIAVAWSGSPQNSINHLKRFPLSRLVKLSLDDRLKVFAIDKTATESDRRLLAESAIEDLSDSVGDFADTAAVIVNCDLVITVDTALAHLAGAVGAPVWVLLSKRGDWRYGQKLQSPWYPKMKLYRQHRWGDWVRPTQEVIADLEQMLASRTAKTI
jgi:hypothetical protein